MSDVTVPPPGSLGEAVNVFFDRASDTLPVFVGRMKALKISLVAGAVVVLLALPFLRELDGNTPTERAQLVGTSALVLGVAVLVQSKVMDTVYAFMLASANTQHLANTHWIGEYIRAVRNAFH